MNNPFVYIILIQLLSGSSTYHLVIDLVEMNLADFVYNLLALEGDKSKPSAKINFFTSSFLSPVGLTRELFKRLLTPGNKFTKVNKQPKSVGGHKL